MTIKLHGDGIALGSVGPRQVPQMPATKSAQPPIQVRRWVRNGKHPNAEYESMKNEALNQAAIWRTKDYCNFIGEPDQLWPASASADLWRFAFRSGPMAHAALCSMILGSPQFGYYQSNSSALLNLHTSASEAAVVASSTFNYGIAPSDGGLAPGGWAYLKVINQYIDITPNTDYYALVRQIDGGNPISFCMFELASMTENFDGYLPQNISAQNGIFDKYRQNQSELVQTLWPDCGPRIFTWSVRPPASPLGPYQTTTSAIAQNILDWSGGGGSTAVSINTPGFAPDMTYKNRKSQTSGVPCVMKAFGSVSAGTGGNVTIKDSTGATVAQINNVFTTTPSWQSVTFNLPAISAKYDVHFSEPSGAKTFSLFAVSIYEKG